jgi:hypothetical protein
MSKTDDEKEITVPRDWFKQLLVIADLAENEINLHQNSIVNACIPERVHQLLGYISSAKFILRKD